MPWTYTANPFPQPWPYVQGSPAPQACIDTVRFLIGDTSTSDQQFQDGEISGLLAQNRGEPYQSSIEAARSLAAKYSRQVDKTVGDLRIAASQKAKQYRDLVKDLTAQSLRHASAVPYAGGIRISDKQNDQSNDDIVTPAYAKGMMDDPGTAPSYGMLGDGFGRTIPNG